MDSLVRSVLGAPNKIEAKLEKDGRIRIIWRSSDQTLTRSEAKELLRSLGDAIVKMESLAKTYYEETIGD